MLRLLWMGAWGVLLLNWQFMPSNLRLYCGEQVDGLSGHYRRRITQQISDGLSHILGASHLDIILSYVVVIYALSWRIYNSG